MKSNLLKVRLFAYKFDSIWTSVRAPTVFQDKQIAFCSKSASIGLLRCVLFDQQSKSENSWQQGEDNPVVFLGQGLGAGRRGRGVLIKQVNEE